jgi:16S rRNA (uracil1498-N3)-methyltransferase
VDAVSGGMAELRGDEARRLARVLRAQPGQLYEISDRRAAYLAEIVEAQPERVAFRVLEPVESKAPPLCVTLCAALIKFDRFEWMVEKTTELGVERIVPVEAARSERGLFEASRKRAERWDRVAKESSQQSRRLQAPEIRRAVRFAESLGEDAEFRYFLDEAAAPPLWRMLPETRTPNAGAALLVGPEGGWTDTERQRAAAAGWQPVSLSTQVLRAETAAAAGVAILVNAWMS